MCDEETSRHAWHRIGSYDMPSDEDEIVGRGCIHRKGYQVNIVSWEADPRRWSVDGPYPEDYNYNEDLAPVDGGLFESEQEAWDSALSQLLAAAGVSGA